MQYRGRSHVALVTIATWTGHLHMCEKVFPLYVASLPRAAATDLPRCDKPRLVVVSFLQSFEQARRHGKIPKGVVQFSAVTVMPAY